MTKTSARDFTNIGRVLIAQQYTHEIATSTLWEILAKPELLKTSAFPFTEEFTVAEFGPAHLTRRTYLVAG